VIVFFYQRCLMLTKFCQNFSPKESGKIETDGVLCHVVFLLLDCGGCAASGQRTDGNEKKGQMPKINE
jgi:hypothetical protein